MTKLPIDLALKTMTSKVSVGAHERLKDLAAKHDAKIQDVLSACLLHMPEDLLVRILAEQQAVLDKLPKPVRNMLRHADQLTDADRAMLREILG